MVGRASILTSALVGCTRTAEGTKTKSREAYGTVMLYTRVVDFAFKRPLTIGFALDAAGRS